MKTIKEPIYYWIIIYIMGIIAISEALKGDFLVSGIHWIIIGLFIIAMELNKFRK